MAVTATFRTTAGTKTWEVSPRKVLDIDGLSTGFELEADNNSAVEGSPLTNERGLKKKQISFSSNFHAALGFDVRAEFDSWETWVGLAGILRFGGERFGANSWLLTGAKATNIQTDPSGRWRSFKMAFTFEESDDTTVDDIEEAEAAIEAAKSAVGVQPPAAFVTAKKAPNPFLAKLLKKTTGSELIIALGDVVRFTGGAQYTTSTGSTVIKNSAAGLAKVTKFAKSAPHPYFLVSADGSTDVAGWVSASQVTV